MREERCEGSWREREKGTEKEKGIKEINRGEGGKDVY